MSATSSSTIGWGTPWLGLALQAATLCGCGGGTTTGSEPKAAAPSTSAPAADEEREGARPEGRDDAADAGVPIVGLRTARGRLEQTLRHAEIEEVSLVGREHPLLRAELRSGVQARLIPRMPSEPRAPEHAVAAYRIARALKIDTVAPAVLRRMSRSFLRSHFAESGVPVWTELRDAIHWNGGATVTVAAVAWLSRARAIHLHQRGRLQRWMTWLTGDSPLPARRRQFAADLSTAAALDYLVAGTDRFADERAVTVPSGKRLLWRGHAEAFDAPGSAAVQRRLHRVKRLSRSFALALLHFDRVALEAALRPREGRSLLTRPELAALDTRRRALRSYVGAVAQDLGPAPALSLP